jgi:GAF domain-containing protein
MKRGVAARRLSALDELRVILNADVTAERMLRSVAAHLATGGDYCIADMIDRSGALRRVEIAHADPGRRERLRVTADHTRFAADGRVAALLGGSGGAEVVGRVTRAAAARAADIVLLHGEAFVSYMAVAIPVARAPLAALTVVACQQGRHFGADELGFLRVVGEWTGLGLENALLRERDTRASVAPASGFDRFDAGEPVTRVSSRRGRTSTA